MGRRRGGEWEKRVQEVSSIKGRYKIDGEVKNSIGNGEAKELICMTYGYELRWGNAGGRGLQGEGGEKNETTVIA